MTTKVTIENPDNSGIAVRAQWIPADMDLAIVDHWVMPGATLVLHPYVGYRVAIEELPNVQIHQKP